MQPAKRGTIEQYKEADAPVVGHGVRLYLGDVAAGRTHPSALSGPTARRSPRDTSASFDGKPYAVIAVRYHDHAIGDEGVLRVERRWTPSGDPIVRVEEGTSAPLPGLDGMSLAVDAIVDHHRADVACSTRRRAPSSARPCAPAR